MTHDEAFLADILAHPDDDTPRLVYADWLEEQDDPRGRYLRAEVELARLNEGDLRYAELESELQQLREGIEPEWLAAAGKRYDVLLHGYRPHSKIAVIKVIRELTGCGLKEAKDHSESVPPVCVLRAVSRAEAERGREQLSYWNGDKVAEVEVRVSGSRPADRPAPGEWRPEARYRLAIRSCPAGNEEALALALREISGLGLPEAKELCERLPVVLPGQWPCEQARSAFARLGALAEVGVQQLPDPSPQLLAGTPGETFELVLHPYPGAQKIPVIKAIREVTGLGLKESKDLAEAQLPAVIRTGLTRDQAVRALQSFARVANVEVRATQPG
jgi:uncharacterized protein (TIGR02996 family)